MGTCKFGHVARWERFFQRATADSEHMFFGGLPPGFEDAFGGGGMPGGGMPEPSPRPGRQQQVL